MGRWAWSVAVAALVAFSASDGAAQATATCGPGGTITVSVTVPQCCSTQPPPDGGTTPPPDAGTPPPDGGSTPASDWLHTQGNRILRADGSRWMGRGSNLNDTRSCGACMWEPPSAAEVNRRADALLNTGVNFIRLDSESYPALDNGKLHGLSPEHDAAYLADLQTIVAHITSRPDTYVLLSLWIHPGHGSLGRPTAATTTAWRQLAHAFKDEPHVFFGVVNEPESNYDGSGDSAVWSAMNDVVQGIRQQEDADGTPHHLVAVQGTGGWARLTQYYVTHPIPSDNIIYEAHIYNPQADFTELVTTPAATLPLVIGEFGPWPGLMEAEDTAALMTLANQLQVPWTAWTAHQRCEPNLLVDHSNWGCGIGMALEPTDWAKQIKGFLNPTSQRRRQ